MYVVSFGCCHDSARSPSITKEPGRTAGPALYLSKRLWVNDVTTWVLYGWTMLWSKCGGSHVRSVSVPPRRGVCGAPREGRDSAARPAALPASIFRRVIMDDLSLEMARQRPRGARVASGDEPMLHDGAPGRQG